MHGAGFYGFYRCQAVNRELRGSHPQFTIHCLTPQFLISTPPMMANPRRIRRCAVAPCGGLVLSSTPPISGTIWLDDRPVLRHANLDAAPHHEDLDDGLAVDRRLAEVDLATAHDRQQVGAAKCARVVAPRYAAENGHRAQRRVRVNDSRRSVAAPLGLRKRGFHALGQHRPGGTRLSAWRTPPRAPAKRDTRQRAPVRAARSARSGCE